MLKNKGQLYAILDTEVTLPHNIDIFTKTEELAKWGVDIFQLRCENIEDNLRLSTAIKLQKIIAKRKKIFIVNDRADIAYLSNAHGLHLGASDIPVSAARKIIGRKKIIGHTCHSSADTLRFQKEDVQYTSVGPLFSTETKPGMEPIPYDEVKRMVGAARKTIFAIGGINLYNINSLGDYQISNVALCRALLLAKDPRETIKQVKECLQKISSKN